MDIINYTNVNPYGISLDTINYQLTDTAAYTDAGSELLHDISVLDTNQEFYYNCRIENSDAIDINTSIDSQTNKPIETLASPYA
ncbi:MAG: hypothetical protein J6W64_01590 [Bacilli bacterium]|nr:hypothetical protein [Bacilli bacterium]